MEPVFLTMEEVLAIHLDQIERYGGDATLRDRSLLESAIAQPAATFGGALLHRDLAEMAASYLFHIVRNHPFVDGNKRTGAVAALVFLELNGMTMIATEDDLESIVLGVAKGTTPKDAVAQFVRDNFAEA